MTVLGGILTGIGKGTKGMDRYAFLQLVREILGDDLLQEKGEVLYNSIDTLAPSDVYLAGYNPGGIGHRSISEDILQDKYNQPGRSKFDEPWANKLYGTRTKELLTHLGYDYHTVFITNTFFSASPTESSLPPMSDDTRQRYMRMHHKLLSIVQPRYVICRGQSAFRQFREWADERIPVFDEELNDGRFYRALYPGIKPVILIGVRHSRGPAPTEEFYNRFRKLRQSPPVVEKHEH